MTGRGSPSLSSGPLRSVERVAGDALHMGRWRLCHHHAKGEALSGGYTQIRGFAVYLHRYIFSELCLC